MYSSPKTLLDNYNIFPKKSLGQNFMHDPQALEKIVACADLSPGDAVVEVGAGTGALTEKLAERASDVYAIEIDRRLQPLLEARFDDIPNVFLIFNDILKIDIRALVGNQDFIVVANVPYYISSAILWHFLESDHPPLRIVLTMQYEVAERIIAQDDNMNLLAVALQYYGEPRIVSKLSPAVFWPRPNIYSAIVQIETHASAPIQVPSPSAFFTVVKAGFSLKRKQLKNALASGLQIKAGIATELLQAADIDPKRRAETLTLQEWGRLCHIVAESSP